jgi:hypothetical protein
MQAAVEQGKERGFASAIAANQADTFAGINSATGIIDEDPCATAQGQVLQSNHLAAEKGGAALQGAAQAIGGTEFFTAQLGIFTALLAIDFGIVFDVFDALPTARKGKGNAIGGLTQYFGAGTGCK